jgi:hypothetical protein
MTRENREDQSGVHLPKGFVDPTAVLEERFNEELTALDSSRFDRGLRYRWARWTLRHRIWRSPAHW